MSRDNEAVVDDSTETDETIIESTEEVVGEQSESEDNEGVANPSDETEQTDEPEEDIDYGDILSGKTEPEKESKIPRSTRRLLRKNSRLEKEIAEANRQLEQLRQSPAPTPQARAPERDWDNETDEQYQFRSMQAVLGHQQQSEQAKQQHAEHVKRMAEDLKRQQEVAEKYSAAVESLKLKDYDEAESRVLDAMPQGSLTYMSKINPDMTAKIIYHLDHNPEKLARFADLAHRDAQGFNYEYGKLESAITELESAARRNRSKVSKATGDRALDGSGASANSIQAKMDDAANRGDFAKYRELKAKLK